MISPTQRLAEYATSLRYDDLPPVVVDKAKQLLLDLLGVSMRAATDADSTPSIRAATLRNAAIGSSSLIGEPTSHTPGDAAFYNASLAHSLDFDDTHREGSIHPGASTVPTVLAIGEREQLDGRRFLTAMVAGYEVTCRLAVALGAKAHYDRGFHPTGTAGVFGATAAGANLLGLSPVVLENAFGVNGSQAAGSLQFFENGAWNKRIHPGLAAKSAYLALELAVEGFVGAALALEGSNGFLHAYSDGANSGDLTKRLGHTFEILATAIKPYPACRYVHAPLDGLIALATNHDIDPSEVVSITVGMSDAGVALVGRPADRKQAPKNVVDGQFSMPFTAAVAIAKRRFTWDDYSLLGDAVVAELCRKVEVVPSAEANKVFPKRWLASVEVRTRNGSYSDVRWKTTGDPESPMTWDQIVAKYDGLSASLLGPDQRQRVVEMVRDFDSVEDVRELGKLLRAT